MGYSYFHSYLLSVCLSICQRPGRNFFAIALKFSAITPRTNISNPNFFFFRFEFFFFFNIFFRNVFFGENGPKKQKKNSLKKTKIRNEKKKLPFEILVRGVIAEIFRAIQKKLRPGR